MRLPSIFRDKILVAMWLLSALADGLAWWLLYSKFHAQTEFVPLHYNIYFGIDLYGPWWRVLLLPLSGTFFLFLNPILSFILYQRAKIISYLLLFSLLVTEIVLLWGAWLLYHELII